MGLLDKFRGKEHAEEHEKVEREIEAVERRVRLVERVVAAHRAAAEVERRRQWA